MTTGKTNEERGAAFGTIAEVGGGLELHAPAVTCSVRKARITADGVGAEIYVDGVLYIHCDHVRADMLPIASPSLPAAPARGERSGTLAHVYAMALGLVRDIDAGRYRGRDVVELDIADALMVDAINLIGHDGPATTSATGAAYYAEAVDNERLSRGR